MVLKARGGYGLVPGLLPLSDRDNLCIASNVSDDNAVFQRYNFHSHELYSKQPRKELDPHGPLRRRPLFNLNEFLNMTTSQPRCGKAYDRKDAIDSEVLFLEKLP